jgi:hypothetical protein
MNNIHHLNTAAGGTTPPARPAPMLTESDAALLIHDSYVMHRKTQLCESCGCGEQFSELFEVWIHPTKTRSTNLHVLRRAGAGALKDLEIAYISLPSISIPLCSECVETFVHPNRISTIGMASRAAWMDTLRRKYTPAEAAKPAAKPEPSLDQL